VGSPKESEPAEHLRPSLARRRSSPECLVAQIDAPPPPGQRSCWRLCTPLVTTPVPWKMCAVAAISLGLRAETSAILSIARDAAVPHGLESGTLSHPWNGAGTVAR
jgi:hypothetical protein